MFNMAFQYIHMTFYVRGGAFWLRSKLSMSGICLENIIFLNLNGFDWIKWNSIEFCKIYKLKLALKKH